ncbi:MAG: peptidyl-prolyl cis-trans isomerase [Fimbriimonadaceae bacterium]|nr:peptidyl-prolyl cis-trans isomerase [Fimbriimonadaceae bacterium]
MRVSVTTFALGLLLAGVVAPTAALAQADAPPVNPPPARVTDVSSETTLIVVNGNRIQGRDYIKRMQVMPNVGRLVNGQFVELAPGFLMLQQMIDEILLLQIARDRGVYPNDADIDAQMKLKLAAAPGIMEGLLALGLTEADLRREAIIDLCEYRILTQGVTVTDQEVEAYYNGNKTTLYTIPKRFVLRVIAVATDDAQRKVDGELAAGTPFAEVAEKYSIEASRIAGGYLGPVTEESLGTDARPIIVGTAKGGLTSWVRSNNTRVRFFVEDILASEVIPFASVKEAIKRKMLLDRGIVRNNMPRMLREARKAARVDYQGTPFDTMLKQLFEQE